MDRQIYQKNKPFWVGIIIGIIVIGGIAIFPIIVELSKPIEPKPIYYIATDDSSRWAQWDDVWGNETWVRSGGNSEGYIKFDLTNKPRYWEKVEISLYIYKWLYGGATIVLFESNWNESMMSKELTQYTDWSICDFWICLHHTQYLNGSVGLQRIDITNYIQNTNVSISVKLENRYDRDGTIHIYSKEANVDKAWLPQLIWS